MIDTAYDMPSTFRVQHTRCRAQLAVTDIAEEDDATLEAKELVRQAQLAAAWLEAEQLLLHPKRVS